MTPDHVTDLLAFACSDAEGWDLLTGDDESEPPAEVLRSGGAPAWSAARAHVLTSAEALLTTVHAQCRTRAPGGDPRFADLLKYAPWSPTTQKNLSLSLPLAGKLASLSPGLEEDWEGKTVRLFLSVKAPAAALAALERRCRAASAVPRREGGYLYLADTGIEEGRSFSEIASSVLDACWPMLLAWLDEVAPVAGRV